MTTRQITVAHSPDSDDAFMFYALATNKIKTGDIKFNHVLSDIETLNKKALKGEYEVTAVSFHAYAYLCREIRSAEQRRQHGRSLRAAGGVGIAHEAAGTEGQGGGSSRGDDHSVSDFEDLRARLCSVGGALRQDL